jgi:hypothetical protein
VIFLFKGRRKESAELEKALIGYYRCQGVCLNVLDGGDAPAATTAVKVSITLRKLGGRRRKVTAVITEVQPELL